MNDDKYCYYADLKKTVKLYNDTNYQTDEADDPPSASSPGNPGSFSLGFQGRDWFPGRRTRERINGELGSMG